MKIKMCIFNHVNLGSICNHFCDSSQEALGFIILWHILEKLAHALPILRLRALSLCIIFYFLFFYLITLIGEEENIHFANEIDIHMSFENYKENDYMYELNLRIILF